MGGTAHFLFVRASPELILTLSKALSAIGYELVEAEILSGKLLRVFIDKPKGV